MARLVWGQTNPVPIFWTGAPDDNGRQGWPVWGSDARNLASQDKRCLRLLSRQWRWQLWKILLASDWRRQLDEDRGWTKAWEFELHLLDINRWSEEVLSWKWAARSLWECEGLGRRPVGENSEGGDQELDSERKNGRSNNYKWHY